MRDPQDTKYVWDKENFKIIDFDLQVNKIRLMLRDKIQDIKNNPNLSEERKVEYIDVIVEQMNKMEFARQVHNHYAVNGEVKIPD